MEILADKLRPKNLDEIIGQTHLIGPGKIIRNLVDNNHLVSMILYGKPGIGKTSIATAIANTINKPFRLLNATINNKQDFDIVIEEAKMEGEMILIMDEIHRLNIERKFWTLHERHFVTMADGSQFEISNELWHIVKDITNIEGLGWQLRGNIAGLNFELYDTDGSVIAVISQKMFSLHDKYCIDIYRPELEPTVVAILVTLQHMIKDREAASSGFSSSSSSSSSGN